MKSDIKIAQGTKELSIEEVAAKVNLAAKDLEPYGHDKAKTKKYCGLSCTL